MRPCRLSAGRRTKAASCCYCCSRPSHHPAPVLLLRPLSLPLLLRSGAARARPPPRAAGPMSAAAAAVGIAAVRPLAAPAPIDTRHPPNHRSGGTAACSEIDFPWFVCVSLSCPYSACWCCLGGLVELRMEVEGRRSQIKRCGQASLLRDWLHRGSQAARQSIHRSMRCFTWIARGLIQSMDRPGRSIDLF